MSTANKISGSTGTVTVGGSPVAVTKWSFKEESDTVETTDSTSGTDAEFISEGHKKRSGSFEGFLIKGTATPTVGGAAAAMVLTAFSGVTYSGNGIITSKDVNVQISKGNGVPITCNFIGTGSWTEANA
jgi:hypothetical protein